MTCCANCHKPKVFQKGLCPACYFHQYRHGQPRPPHKILREWERSHTKG